MSLSCSELAPLLAARVLGAIDAGEEAAVAEHLAGCPSCGELIAPIETALLTARPTPLDPSPDVWTRLEARIVADAADSIKVTDKVAESPEPSSKTAAHDSRSRFEARAPGESRQPRAPDRLAARIALACTFCHSEVLRIEAIFCGSCLAPHHESCFLQHGRCSAPGCLETRTVRPRESQPRPARPSPARSFAHPMVLVAIASTIGAAALIAAMFTPPTIVGEDGLPPPVPAPLPLASPPMPSTSPDPPPGPWTRPSPFAVEAPQGTWLQEMSFTGPDELSVCIRTARKALEAGQLDDAEEALLAAGARGFNVVQEVWGNALPQLEPLRDRPGFFVRAASVKAAFPVNAGSGDPFARRLKESGR